MPKSPEKFNCVLLKRPSKHGDFLDLFLVWLHNDRVYYQRISPTFRQEYKFLMSHATLMGKDEPFDKYI